MKQKQVETRIYVILNGNVMANCAGLDVATATLEGILSKISNNKNFALTIQKTTEEKEVEVPDEKPVEEKKEEVKEEEVKSEKSVDNKVPTSK